jgi:hypothetical protein
MISQLTLKTIPSWAWWEVEAGGFEVGLNYIVKLCQKKRNSNERFQHVFSFFPVAARQCVPILADEIYGDMVSRGQDRSLL